MKQLLNTLYVSTPDSYLSSEGNNVLVIINNKLAGRVP